MKKLLLLFAGLSVLSVQAQTIFTHSSNQNIWSANSAACTTSGPGTIHNNSFIRVFDTDDFGVQDTAFLLFIHLGVESTSGGAYDIMGRVHRLDGTLAFANMTLIEADTAAVLPDSTIYKMKIYFEDGGYVLPGDTVVAEVFAPINPVIIFFPGSNPYVESGTSYIAAAGCGLLEPTPYADIGFPTAHLVLNLWVNHRPTLNNLAVSVFKNNTLNFLKTDFDAAMMDYDADTVGLIRIETLPGNGTLKLDGTALNVGDTVYNNELDLMTYTPTAGFSGSDSYDVRVRDAYHWANFNTQIDITVFDWQVGLEEQTLSNFTMFPNPADNVVTLTAAEKIQSVRIFDMQGAEIELKVTSNGQMDVSELASGIYFVAVKTEAGISVQKLVKQ